MSACAVTRYLAETARRDSCVSGWIAELPAIVADLAGRRSLQVGEPFQPGGQYSRAAPVTDPAGADLVLEVGFRFPGGEERDEAAGLRLWDGNGAVRLHAAHHSESAYALLIERCMPGTSLGQTLPEPEQDQVVARLLHQLWAQPYAAHPFRPLSQMCAAWADEFEQEYEVGVQRASMHAISRRRVHGSASAQVTVLTPCEPLPTIPLPRSGPPWPTGA